MTCIAGLLGCSEGLQEESATLRNPIDVKSEKHSQISEKSQIPWLTQTHTHSLYSLDLSFLICKMWVLN